jgi:hypothetical protein
MPSRPSDVATVGCREGFTGFWDTTPYGGPPPHPIAFALVADGASITFPQWPQQWQTSTGLLVQLVGCVTQVKRGTLIRTCPMRMVSGGVPITLNLYHVTDTLEVRDVYDGHILRSVDLNAADTACPASVRLDSLYDGYDIEALLTLSQVRQAIGDLVE